MSDDVHILNVAEYHVIQFIIYFFQKYFFAEGHNGINLIPIDPLHIPSIGIKQGSDSPVNIELKFTDSDLMGLSKHHFTKVE